MRKLLQRFLRRPVIWLSDRFSSNPDKGRIYNALTKLYLSIINEPGKKGQLIPITKNSRIIIFSDQHKGDRNGADDFTLCEPNYTAALRYYYENDFTFINLGDCEELWENTLSQVKKANARVFETEKLFVEKDAYVKIFGNHDLYWGNDPLANVELEKIYGTKIKIYEGIVLTLEFEENTLKIFCTHGHQGDRNNDGNWFTKFFIARIWAPFQAYLRINPNEPSNDFYKKTIHNEIMYEWSSTQPGAILITGHTHQPVFESLTHIERLYLQRQQAQVQKDDTLISKINEEVKNFQKRFDTLNTDYSKILPCYFNTGCCCFSDGDITGIEIDNGYIRLIKWENKNSASSRIILEEALVCDLMK